MKQITIIGASAGVGLLTVKQALQNRNKAIALSRNLTSLPDDTNLIKIEGSATSVDDVKKSIADSDAIIIAIGNGNSTKKTTLFTDAAIVILKALKEMNLQIPLIVLTGFGAGDSAPFQPFPMNLVFRFLLKDVYANKTEMEKMIASNYSNWVMVRPATLTNKDYTGSYRVVDKLTKGMKISSISRADVAHYLVSQAEHPTEIKKYVSLSK